MKGNEKHFCWEPDCKACAKTPLEKADEQMALVIEIKLRRKNEEIK